MVITLLAVALAAAPAQTGPDTTRKAVDARAALEALKGLEGEWVGAIDAPDGPTARVVYHTIAAGSAVVERLFVGQPEEMETVYHLDGDSLVLTHYCAGGNQPRMKLASASSAPLELRFDFTGGSNLDPAKDSHMHAARLRIESERVVAEWSSWAGGKPAGGHTFYLSRKK